MSEAGAGVERALSATIFIRGANRPFGELTIDDVKAHAEELRAITGWGPTARVAPVARAWRSLAIEMERTGAPTVNQLDPAQLAELAPQLWVVLPG
jgi:hypothetical protein